MKATETKLKGCWIIEPDVYEDERGYFYEGFNIDKFKNSTGLDFSVKQINQSRSSYGVLRGLHFQIPPKAQSKFISCLEGEVLDVAVDLRKNSPTYLQHEVVRLSTQNKKHFYIPKGMAHGFLVLSETAKLMYQVDEMYSPEHDSGISYNDPQINVPWGISENELILSTKDKNLKKLSEINLDF